MTHLCCDVLKRLEGKTLATAESCTGGGIGQAITSVSGASAVFAGGVISYTNKVKHMVLGVPVEMLDAYGAVSAPVAKAMAEGVRRLLEADVAVAVTGLADANGVNAEGNAGLVYIGYSDAASSLTREYHFTGGRAQVREKTVKAALLLILEMNQDENDNARSK